MRITQTIATCMLLALSLPGLAQQDVIELDAADYARMKAEGQLTGKERVHIKGERTTSKEKGVKKEPTLGNPGRPKGGGPVAQCDLWQPTDGCPAAVIPQDDGPSSEYELPFAFNLYGTIYNSIWVNNNGNVSFGEAYGTFSPDGFPNPDFVMVAPFWADVMTSETLDMGQVLICFNDENTRCVITWDSVGYFLNHNDKRNSFQLIITNGLDPLIGVGNNVAFVYQDMSWTTGDASNGVDGFGGYPAVVGGNLGDGSSYIQIGTFDHAGTDYDGPFDNADGVDWLDYKTFVFSTMSADANIPPLASGNVLCDTVETCDGSPFNFDVDFFSPEPDQTTSVTVEAPTLGNVTFTPVQNGSSTTVQGVILPSAAEVGTHVVTITGTDTGTPEGVTQVVFVLRVIPNPSDPPVVTGDALFCDGTLGQLSVNPDYDSYEWSNGATGTNISISQPGPYTVTVSNGGICAITSEPFIVTTLPLPQPQITGASFSCGGTPVVLSTTEQFPAYQWSNGGTQATTTVSTGAYYVSVTNSDGCTGASDIFAVQVANDPTASFTADPPSPQFPGSTVDFMDMSSGNGQSIASYQWSFGNGQTSTDVNPEMTFSTPGTYVVQLITTTTGGCADTTRMSYVIRAEEVVVPNIFSPNSDGVNDALVFENAQYYKNELAVFNRWGQKIYEKQDYRNTWQAPDVPSGTYFFTLKLTESSKEYKGDITIVR